MEFSLTAEQIKENYDRFEALCQKLGDRTESMNAMLADIGDRLALCPASSRSNFHRACPGGLIEHSLRVLTNAMKLCKTFEWEIPKDSLIIACLMHDLGKVGSLTKDKYLPQSSDWHRNKGMVYESNEELLNGIEYMSVPDRSIFLLQHYGVKLLHEEMLAIKLNDGFVVNENKEYCLKTPKLAWLIMTADYVATMQEKNIF
jgi:HD domain